MSCPNVTGIELTYFQLHLMIGFCVLLNGKAPTSENSIMCCRTSCPEMKSHATQPTGIHQNWTQEKIKGADIHIYMISI